MRSCFLDLRHRKISFRLAHIAVASLAALIAAGDLAGAASGHSERSVESVESRAVGEPIMAIVSLRGQQITVYDANGWILRAPVSSGQAGRETPAGIFSIIGKEAEHYSNLYDDAYMPHMQRLTWSGIALHGGPLPGHPASHGCVRMPYDFAERLFDLTKLGMRVIVAPNDVAPASIAHPALFQPKPDAGAVAAARAAEADEAASKADKARLAAIAASREVAQAMLPVRVMRNLKLRSEAQLAAAESAITSAGSAEAKEQAEDAKVKAAAKIAELEAQLAVAEVELIPKYDALAAARLAAAAETARAEVAEVAREAARAPAPVSLFISRKTQRLYVRQASQPILEIPITIQDPDLPIGTHVFTAMELAGNGVMQWSVVSLVGRHPEGGKPDLHRPEVHGGRVEQTSTNSPSAKAALDRVVIPQDTFDRVAEMVSPRSSLIISDEALSSETGRGTEFVVLMSGEPQGGIKHRRRGPEVEVRYERPSHWLPY
ncbi:MAG: L,D-transpeptidase family protein [Xanthobacteraceae bacterium]